MDFLMNPMFMTIAGTGFTVAFFHAAIPTHWLPFVMAGRAQRWTTFKTLMVTALAGGGHVLVTTILGVLIVWLGIAIDRKVGDLFPWLAGGALVAFGLFYVVRQWRGHGHTHLAISARKHEAPHHHEYQGTSHEHWHDHARVDDPASFSANETTRGAASESSLPSQRVSDWVAIGSLLALLTFSPCEGFLPVYLSGIRYGWPGFALLSAILAGATLAGMIAFTWLTLWGLAKLNLAFVERHESGILGGLLCILGILVILLEH